MTLRSSAPRRNWHRDAVTMQKHAHWYVDLMMNQLTKAKLEALDELVKVAKANNKPGQESSSSLDALPTLEEGKNLFLEHLRLDPRPLDSVFPLVQPPRQMAKRTSGALTDDLHAGNHWMCRELAEQMRTLARKGREMEEKEVAREEGKRKQGQSLDLDLDLQPQPNPKPKKRGRRPKTPSSSSSSD